MSICTRRATRPRLQGRKSVQGGHIQGCLHPGKLGVCYPALVSSWSISPTTELGLHPAPSPQAEGGLGSRGGRLLQPRAGGGFLPREEAEEGLGFQPGKGGDGGAPGQLGAQPGIGAKPGSDVWGKGRGGSGTTSWPERALKNGVKGR